MIVDEGHRMKNHNSKLATTIAEYYRTKYRVLLTGYVGLVLCVKYVISRFNTTLGYYFGNWSVRVEMMNKVRTRVHHVCMQFSNSQKYPDYIQFLHPHFWLASNWLEFIGSICSFKLLSDSTNSITQF